MSDWAPLFFLSFVKQERDVVAVAEVAAGRGGAARQNICRGSRKTRIILI